MRQENDNSKLTFPKLDIVSDFSDHHFLGRDPPCSAGSSFLKAISKEWRILQENLPESIFVRVSDTRSDLLRAAIIGAAGTPYHDALFFFDVALTANYPNEPPKVHYLSHGHRVNPNLYSNGKVCLSLLNTWFGGESELWNPELSTLLQVLLSLQSLVLNEKPYYNEPAYHEKQNRENKKWSEYYSQDVFLLTWRTTINLIQNPPKNCEPLIKHHFHQRANAILAACEAYANGRVMVGFYGCDGAAPPPGFKIRDEFQTRTEVVYAKLVAEFRRIEACVPPTAERLVVMPNRPVITKKRKGIFGWMMDKIIEMFFTKFFHKKSIL